MTDTSMYSWEFVERRKAEVRDAAIEEAAQVADAYVNEAIANAIRALKVKS